MQKIEKISFLQSVISVCAGREIFKKLKSQAVWRTLVHFVFLAFICSCFIMIAGHEEMLKEIETPLQSFENSAGGIVCKNGAFYPSKDPEKPYEIMLAPKFKLVYSPDLNVFQSNWINKDGTTFLWFPRFWCFTVTSPAHSTVQVLSGFPDSSWQDNQEFSDRDALMEYLRKRSIEAEKKTYNHDARTLMVSRIEIERLYLGIRFFYYWFEFCLQALVLTVLFSVFYRFVGGRNYSSLKFREIFCCGFYASMPPMIVASFFPALDLPFFKFTTIFAVGYLIYLICVLNSLEIAAYEEKRSK